MKKFFGLLACLFLLMGCDDGEMTFDTFNFSAATPQLCDAETNTYVFINGTSKEVLVIRFPASTFLNIQSDPGPITVTGLEYRVYEGVTPTVGNICGGLDNSGLSVRENWTGSGTIDVITTRVETEGVVTYRHAITLVDVSFNKDGETIRILDNYLGELETQTGYDFDFADNDDPETNANPFARCNTAENRFTLTQSNEALLATITPDNLPTTEGDTTISLTDEGGANFISFLVYNSSSITSATVCQGNAISPTLIQRWATLDAGEIVVHTISTGTNEFTHLLYLRNVVFYNSLSNGESFTPTPNITTGTYANTYYIGRIVINN